MKSKIAMIIALALALCCVPAIAQAENTVEPQAGEPRVEESAMAVAGATPSGSPEPDEPPPAPDSVLAIDNGAVYDGMDKPYSQGYVPSAAGGVAKIVLPLTSASGMQDNRVNVSFDLGDPSSSPFQFGNYDKTVKLSRHATNKGEKDAYLIHVDLPLAANRVMGRYPVVIRARGTLADGTAFAQEFTVYVTITDGVDPDAPEPTEEPQPEPVVTEEPPVPQPRILLSSYSINPSPAVAGEVFHLTATLANTNENQPLNNVIISIAGETADVLPSGKDTGNFYFKKIGKGESVTLDLDMVTSPNIKPEPHKLTVSVEYEGNKATAYTASEEIVVPVSQPIRLEYDEPQIPQEVNAGDTIPVSLNVMNLGIGAVHNARLSLEAPGLIPDKTAFMGNIASGEAKKGDMYVFVGTMDMTEDGGQEEKYGRTNGVMTLTYEDEYGKEYTETFEFSTNINPPVIATPDEPEDEEEPKRTGQWWISIIIAGAVIGGIIALRAYIRKREREKQANEDG